MKYISKLLFVATIYLISGNTLSAAPPLSVMQEIKEFVDDIRYDLPANVGNGLSITQIDYDSKTYSIVYSYHYLSQVDKPNSNSVKEARLAIIHMLRARPNSDEMQLIKSGISFQFNYYNNDGTYLYSVRITPADVR